MKFDPNMWQEVPTDETFLLPAGRVKVRCLRPGALLLGALGQEAPAGFASEWSLTLAEPTQAQVIEGVRVWFFAPRSSSVQDSGEVFTNMDRKPMESGAMAETTKALRLMQMHEMQMMRRLSAERRALEALRPQEEVDPETGEILGPKPKPDDKGDAKGAGDDPAPNP